MASSSTPTTQRAVDGRSIAAYVAFFLSGASSLIFQTIWTRMLHHVFGATSVAISTVLTLFMAGLGLGAWLGGKYANRIKHPIITYAVAEIGVGVWGLLVPLLVRSDGWLATVNAFLRAEFGAESGMFMVARFLCVAPILFIPTTLMGSTLPLLTRHFVANTHQAREAGARVGILYAVNTFGAATGPILSAFFLMPSFGLSVTNIVACSLNFTLAILIFGARKSLLRGAWKPGDRLIFWPVAEEVKKAEPEDESVTYREPPPRRDKEKISTDTSEAAVPELARKAAFLAFAASGAAALCYEVVWARALAMTIGSSIYSFSLILETFLIGIATGAAVMSAFLGRKSAPYVGIGVAAGVLVLLANIPWAIDIVNPSEQTERLDGSMGNYVLLNLLYLVPIALGVIWMSLQMRRAKGPGVVFRDDDVALWKPIIIVAIASMPVVAAAVNSIRFPGLLPKIILSVVALVAVFLTLSALLARVPVLLIALIQLFIAGAAVVTYYWQDDIPYAFAQLVASIPQHDLPEQVGTVQFFMFLTIVLSTIPPTLGMGAMFPLTVRLWTSGGDEIARDVGSVYTANTVGSIIGSWLPGFILFALIGAERTLHVGIALNTILALLLLIAGAADPDEDQSWWTWPRVNAVGLPFVATVVMGVDAWVTSDGTERIVRAAAAVLFLALAVAEYQWLTRCDRGSKPRMEIAAPAAIAPFLATLVLVFALGSPDENALWAAQAIVFALKGFLIFVGAVTSWINWRAWSERATSAPPAEASGA